MKMSSAVSGEHDMLLIRKGGEASVYQAYR
jgi:hypothetical protein